MKTIKHILSLSALPVLVLMFISLGAHISRAASPAVEGDSAYNKADYVNALSYYNRALAQDGASTELYYNIGNAHYRLGDLGHAVIAYERALKLDPSNTKARHNLAFVNSRLHSKPEDDSSYLSNVHQRIVSFMSPDAWAWTAFICFAVMLGLVALYIFTANVNARKIGFFGAIVMLCVFIYTVVIAYSTANAINDHETAVVIVPSTNMSSIPASSDKNQKVVPVYQGVKVSIIDSVATPEDPMARQWYHVKINNSTSAWVSGSDIERI